MAIMNRGIKRSFILNEMMIYAFMQDKRELDNMNEIFRKEFFHEEYRGTYVEYDNFRQSCLLSILYPSQRLDLLRDAYERLIYLTELENARTRSAA